MKLGFLIFVVGLFIISCNEVSIDIPIQSPKKESPRKSKTIKKENPVPELKIHGFVYHNESPLSDVAIDIYSDDKLIHSVKSGKDGSYKLDSLPINHEYIIAFSKNKYLGKFCLIEKTNPDEIISLGDFPLEISTNLYRINDYDYSKVIFTKHEPAARCYYDSTIDNLKWDMQLIKEYQLKLDQAKVN